MLYSPFLSWISGCWCLYMCLFGFALVSARVSTLLCVCYPCLCLCQLVSLSLHVCVCFSSCVCVCVSLSLCVYDCFSACVLLCLCLWSVRALQRYPVQHHAAKSNVVDRIIKVNERLEEIDADAAPSLAAKILSGLGFVLMYKEGGGVFGRLISLRGS